MRIYGPFTRQAVFWLPVPPLHGTRRRWTAATAVAAVVEVSFCDLCLSGTEVSPSVVQTGGKTKSKKRHGGKCAFSRSIADDCALYRRTLQHGIGLVLIFSTGLSDDGNSNSIRILRGGEIEE